MNTHFSRLKSWVLIQVNKNWTKIGFDFQNLKKKLVLDFIFLNIEPKIEIYVFKRKDKNQGLIDN